MAIEDRSKVAVFPDKTAIKEEAGLWIVRMDERPLDPRERKELEDWVRQSDFHRDYLMKLASNWDSMGALEALAEMFPLPDREPKHRAEAARRGFIKNRTSVRWGWFGAVALACCGLLAVGIFLFGSVFQGIGNQELVTAIGERASYTLEDGTVISLNTNTRIEVNYTEARRAVILVQGEATFDVAKNPEKPFVVYAGNGLVWAVGTTFNVRYLGEVVDVLVTEGRVKVFSGTQIDNSGQSLVANLSAQEDATFDSGTPSETNDGRMAGENKSLEALIEAGQGLRYTTVIETLEFVGEEEFERKLAWQSGSLIFKGETLREAITEIGRYTDKEFIILDPELEKLRVGGHYKTGDIESLLDSLGQGLGLNVEYAADDRVILSVKGSG